MAQTEARPLARMRTITTWVMVGTVTLVGGAVMFIAADAWWHVALVAPALVLAAWIASRWHSRPGPAVLWGSLAFGQVTWAVAVLVGVDIPAAVPVAAIGAVMVATTPGSRGLRGLGLLVMIGGTSLLSLVNAPESLLAYVVGSLLYGVIFIGTFWLNDIAWRLFTELDEMRAKEAELAVVKERMRFAADLHDIQGHTLHVIKLKAAVAAKLQHVDPSRVAAELADIERLTADTIEHAQDLVNSTRQLSFAGELANASALLTAAGMEISVSGDGAQAVADSGLFALVLREATTNILRHPAASSVGVVISADALVISNDGATNAVGAERGLAALRERVAQAGGALSVAHEGSRFTVSLALARESV